MQRQHYAAAFLLVLSLLSSPAAAQTNRGDQILGSWETEVKDGKIDLYKVGTTYAGNLSWGKSMFEADGKTSRKDVKNPEPALRERPLHNLPILTGFMYDGENWINGTIYDPESGKNYSCIIKYKEGKLHIRGYVGLSFLGRTTVWTRVR